MTAPTDKGSPRLRTALVTGASSGIGRAVARRLLADGHTVIGVARDFGKFACDEPHFHAATLDLAELDTLPARLDQLLRSHPSVDTVVCCAGRGQFGALEEFSYAQIRALMDLNFSSQAYVVRTFLPAMKRADFGDILFIGSETALAGGPKGAIYSASKAALRGMAQALRGECARRGVRVTVINPGMVNTEFFDELGFAPGEDEENYVLPDDIADAVALVLAARPGTVFDEINLSPLKKVVRTRKRQGEE